jgi:hypothetical protein
MKFVFYKVKNKKKQRNAAFGVSVERMLFFSFIGTFILMILVQTALLSPSIRTYLSVDSEYEGTPLALEEYLFEDGALTLKLVNTEKNSLIKVLVNGDSVADFSINEVSIRVKDGDVVEIDGSQSKSAAEVKVISKTENVISDCLNKPVRVQANIKSLVKVRVD